MIILQVGIKKHSNFHNQTFSQQRMIILEIGVANLTAPRFPPTFRRLNAIPPMPEFSTIQISANKTNPTLIEINSNKDNK